MVAKFVILALFAVAMAQDFAPNTENEIKKALFRLRGMASGAERGVNGCLREIEYKRSALETKAKSFLEREMNSEQQIQRNIRRVAEEMERRAEELNKPQSTFDCIYKNEKLYTTRVAGLGNKFETDINRLQRTKLDSIDTASKPLKGIKDGLEERYEAFANELRKCKDSVCVRKVMDRARREYDLVGSDCRRISSQVLTAYSQFSRDAGNMLANFERSANRIAGEGIRAIKACVFRRTLEESFEIENEEIEY